MIVIRLSIIRSDNWAINPNWYAINSFYLTALRKVNETKTNYVIHPITVKTLSSVSILLFLFFYNPVISTPKWNSCLSKPKLVISTNNLYFPRRPKKTSHGVLIQILIIMRYRDFRFVIVCVSVFLEVFNFNVFRAKQTRYIIKKRKVQQVYLETFYLDFRSWLDKSLLSHW